MSDVYPSEAYPSEAAILALDGTTDLETGLAYIAKGVNRNSTPSYEVQYNRRLERLNTIVALINAGRVADEGGLEVGVYPADYYYLIEEQHFAGATGYAVDDDVDTYLWVDGATNTLDSGTAFPADRTTFLPLAMVRAIGGDIVVIDDKRGGPMRHIPGANDRADYANAPVIDNVTEIDGLTTPLSVGQGGTGAATAAGARTALGAAASGANADITEINGLTTQLAIDQGGTGAATAAGARTALGAAESGANADITEISGLTTPVATDMGGTGAITPTAARANLSAAKSGANTDITGLTGLTTPLGAAYGGTGLTAAAIAPYSPSIYWPGTLSVKVYETEWVAPVDFTLKSATGRVKTAPTGDTAIIDVRVNGSSIYANQTEMINIAAGTNQDASAAKNHAVTAGDVITIEVEQIGSGAAGADLAVVLDGRTALQV